MRYPSLTAVRDAFVPGLSALRGPRVGSSQWGFTYGIPKARPAPVMSVGAALLAIVMRNPLVSRRFWRP